MTGAHAAGCWCEGKCAHVSRGLWLDARYFPFSRQPDQARARVRESAPPLARPWLRMAVRAVEHIRGPRAVCCVGHLRRMLMQGMQKWAETAGSFMLASRAPSVECRVIGVIEVSEAW